MTANLRELLNSIGYYLLPRYITIFGGKIKRRGDELVLKYAGKQLRFKYLEWAAYPLNEIFVKEVYGKLNVKDKVVVDIGASMADTATYFSLRGAKHVYGFEVNPERWKVSKENLRKNSIKNATLYLSVYKPSLVKKNATVLKVDCEGCEYSLFRNLGSSLKRFEQVIVEYHSGSGVIEKQFSSFGFKIKFLTPKNSELGVLLATRKKEK